MAINKHLTELERALIEKMLKERVSIKQIAKEIGKDKSTVSREIRKHALASDKYAPYRTHNRCAKSGGCQKRQLCFDKPNCTKRCSTCNFCNSMCDEFEEQICQRLFDPPYVCNGCVEECRCVLRKKYYIPRKAHEAYKELLVESRAGANITEDELLALDGFVSPLIMRGQSVHHIVANNPDQFDVSEKSIYRYVDGGLLKARNIDMPRVPRMKPRKSKPIEHKVDTKCRIGRSFSDFNSFMEGSGVSPVEMDSVIGRPGGKTLLTFMFKSCDFMLAFIRPRNTSQSVIDVFNLLHGILGADCFHRLFPVVLTDNGSEFTNPDALEFGPDGNRRTKIFYCDPYAAFQKPNVELNHEFVRRVLPKGSSFDVFEQREIDIMMSHINSYTREKLNNRSPFDVFGFLYGFDVLAKLGASKIPANEIILKPSLLK
jgi:IS30 family transposase